MSDEIKLLMVDDDAELLALLKVKLEKTGRFSVTTTTNGAKAVSLAKEISADLIILDIDMPEMSGGEVADTLAADDLTRDIPQFFLSSLITREDAGKGLQVIGGRRMVSKFAKVSQLIDAIDSMLNPS